MAYSAIFLIFFLSSFIFISNTFRIGFLLVKIDKMIDEMNIL